MGLTLPSNVETIDVTDPDAPNITTITLSNQFLWCIITLLAVACTFCAAGRFLCVLDRGQKPLVPVDFEQAMKKIACYDKQAGGCADVAKGMPTFGLTKPKTALAGDPYHLSANIKDVADVLPLGGNRVGGDHCYCDHRSLPSQQQQSSQPSGQLLQLTTVPPAGAATTVSPTQCSGGSTAGMPSIPTTQTTATHAGIGAALQSKPNSTSVQTPSTPVTTTQPSIPASASRTPSPPTPLQAQSTP